MPVASVILSGAPRRVGPYESDGRAVEGSRRCSLCHAAV